MYQHPSTIYKFFPKKKKRDKVGRHEEGVKINGSESKGVNGNLNIWDKGCFPTPSPVVPVTFYFSFVFEVIGSFCCCLFFG